MPRKYGGTWQQRFDWAGANTQRDPQQMEDLRRHLLGDLLRHAAAQVPYYRQLFKQLGVRPEEMLEVQRFAQLPLLTRTHLRQQLNELVAEDADPRVLERNSTGGSTGIPTPYYHSREFARQSALVIQRNKLWTGWRPGDALVKIWGSAHDVKLQENLRQRTDNLLRNEITLPAYAMTAEVLASWPQQLRTRRSTKRWTARRRSSGRRGGWESTANPTTGSMQWRRCSRAWPRAARSRWCSAARIMASATPISTAARISPTYRRGRLTRH